MTTCMLTQGERRGRLEKRMFRSALSRNQYLQLVRKKKRFELTLYKHKLIWIFGSINVTDNELADQAMKEASSSTGSKRL